MNNLRLGPKMVGAFVIIALICTLVGAVGIRGVGELEESITDTSDNQIPSVIALYTLSEAQTRAHLQLHEAIIALRDKETEVYRTTTARLEESWKHIDEASRKYEAIPMTHEEKTAWDDHSAKFQVWQKANKAAAELAAGGNATRAWTLASGKASAAFRETKLAFDRLMAAQMDDTMGAMKTAHAAVTSTRQVIVTGIVVAVIAAVVLGLVLSTSITGPVAQAIDLFQEMARGHLRRRLRMKRGDEIGVLADTIDAFADDLVSIVATMQEIARGDLSTEVVAQDAHDEIRPALKQITDNLRSLAGDTEMLTRAALEGRLATRADAQKHQGEYRKIVEGVNSTLDAVIGPLNVAADYVDRIGRGVIPPKITENYRGDFNTIKSNINACVDGLGGLVEASTVLQRMAVNDYHASMQGTYVGVFDDVKQAVNAVQDRVKNVIHVMKEVAHGELNQLSELKRIGRRSDQDERVPSMIATVESVQALVADATQLSQAAVEGRLTYRADGSRHQGQYRQVIEGVNATPDAVLGPVNEVAQVLDRLAERDLTAQMEGDYRGDLARIKNALNHAVENLSEALSNVAVGAEQVTSASQQISQMMTCMRM